MTVLVVASLAFGMLGILFGLRCYYELWRWARICQASRIAIAYKRKVKLQGPLTDFIEWVKMLEKDKASQGRVIYSMGGTSVAITRADAVLHVRLREWVRIQRAKRHNRKHPQKGGSVTQGVWSATDQTPQENRAKA